MTFMSFNSNTTRVECRTGTAYPSGATDVTYCFSFSFLPVCCLSFFDLRLLISALVSSSISFSVLRIMKRKFKQWWSTIQPISTKRTTTSHRNSLNTKKDQDICRRKCRPWRLTSANMWQGYIGWYNLNHPPFSIIEYQAEINI